MKLSLALLFALAGCAPPLTRPPPTSHPARVCTNQTGTSGGFFYTFWKDGGSACMILGSGGEYGTRYRLGTSHNMVAGKGWAAGLETRRIGYTAEFDPGANSYLTLYGWSTDPLVEYYVVDSWGGFTPPGGGSVMGTVTSDGATYTVYRTRRVNAPSIRGTASFDQFWSVRTAKRPTGTRNTITFANHVHAWRSKGMRLGTLSYQVMATEGFGSNGSSKLTVWQR